MTLCIAAVCGTDEVVLMSDRMISLGGKRYSPPVSKIYPLHHSAVLLYSGGVALANRIAIMARDAIQANWSRDSEGPNALAAAEVYRQQYKLLLAREAPEYVLEGHLFTDINDYRSQRLTLPKEYVEEIDRRLADFAFGAESDPSVIIASVGTSGPQLCTISGHEIVPSTHGFAVVGSTQDRAFAILEEYHSPNDSLPRVLMCAYVAKRRGESRRSGVGPRTDIHIFGPEPGQIGELHVGSVMRQLYDQTPRGRRRVEEAIRFFEGWCLEKGTQAADSARSSPNNATTSRSDQT